MLTPPTSWIRQQFQGINIILRDRVEKKRKKAILYS